MENLYAGKDHNFGLFPTEEKKGLIREIARKVADGVHWAVEWERKHLPQQRAWVKKEFEKAKELAHRGYDKVKDKVEQMKEDMDDVRDELDTDDDGDQDISMHEFQQTNAQIKQQLNTIDLDNSGVPDHVEDRSLVIEEEKPITFPLPTPTPHETFGGKVKRKVHEFQEHRQEQKEMLTNMSDRQLEEKAVRTPTGFFGSNIYEKELLRRQAKRVQLKKKVEGTKRKAMGEDDKESGLDFGFINPLGTFKK
jgi:hypothetical protein